MDTSMIVESYQDLSASRTRLHKAAQMVIDLEKMVKDIRAMKTASGEITGKNTDERDYNARIALVELYGQLARLEVEEKVARLDFDIAVDRVEMVRALLRLAEIEAKAVVE